MSLRRTPFHAHHVAAGARMVEFAGFDMPVQYTGVKPEHLATRSAAGLFDVSHMGEIRVSGPAAEDSLMWLLSNAIKRLQPGQAQYNAMCNERGGVVDDVFVYRLAADDFVVCVNAANRDKDFAWMTEHDRAGATIVDQGNDWAQVAVQGPAAVKIVSGLTDAPVADLGRHRFVVAPFAGVEGCLVARTGYTGEDGFEIFLPADQAAPVWPALLEAGADEGLVPVGLGARDTLRLEAGNCLYGHELDDDTTPLAAGLGWITKLRKPGGFLGSEAIEARRTAGEPVLVGFQIEGKRIARDGMNVLVDDEVVGRVTSGTLGPSVGAPIGLAYVAPAHAAEDTQLTIDVRGRPAPARVVPTPFLRGS
jgi:aminomethyltransferase